MGGTQYTCPFFSTLYPRPKFRPRNQHRAPGITQQELRCSLPPPAHSVPSLSPSIPSPLRTDLGEAPKYTVINYDTGQNQSDAVFVLISAIMSLLREAFPAPQPRTAAHPKALFHLPISFIVCFHHHKPTPPHLHHHCQDRKPHEGRTSLFY